MYGSHRQLGKRCISLPFLAEKAKYNNWFTLICIFIPIFIAFYYRIHIEEKVLYKAFGNKYEEYIRNTGKLFPKIF